MAPIAAVIMGHSFINHMARFIQASVDPTINTDFNLSRSAVNVIRSGRSGCTINKFRKTEFVKLRYYRPDILYLELGTNDLSSGRTAEDIAADMVNLIQDIKRTFNPRHIVLGQVIFRDGNPDFNGKVNEYNALIKELLSAIPYATFWVHKRLWNSTYPLLKADGVHPNQRGLLRLYKSIRGAIWSQVTKIQGAEI